MENSRWKTSTVRKRGKRDLSKSSGCKGIRGRDRGRSVACARKLLEGNQEAIYELREKLADLEGTEGPSYQGSWLFG